VSIIRQNISLKNYNTFGIDVSAKLFGQFTNVEELQNIITDKNYIKEHLLILGGGSNILFTKNLDGIALHNQITGINIVEEDDNSALIVGGSGVVWHDFVLHAINANLGGLENMSLIPGSLGASPMQNIGAYGVEVKDRFEWLEAYHIKSGEIHRFNNDACEFGYRESIFKRKNKGQYIITKVAFRLTKKHELNTSYGAIEQELETLNITEPTIKNVSNAVIKIRESKLPDPKKIGNSGSFFKNPIVDNASFEDIKAKFPKIVSYPAGNGKMKIAAGWLIDQAGWKGRTMGNYGVHKNQALVLVNYGGSSGSDIYKLSEEIIQSIKDTYGIELEREVNIL
jgi:UDP-N-acetylmuramate dehydrogenase